MGDYKIVNVFEQEGMHDGKFKLTIDPYLLMKIINHGAAEDDVELEDMENPKRLAVKITIETKELADEEEV